MWIRTPSSIVRKYEHDNDNEDIPSSFVSALLAKIDSWKYRWKQNLGVTPWSTPFSSGRRTGGSGVVTRDLSMSAEERLVFSFLFFSSKTIRDTNKTRTTREKDVSNMTANDSASNYHRTEAQDKRLQFWNNVVYETMAPLYNCLDWLTCGAWWALQRCALEHISSSRRILEVGFGPGRLFQEIATIRGHPPDLIALDGIDLAEGMCRFTRRRLEKAGLMKKNQDGTMCTIRIVRGSVYDMPYSDRSFDTVVSTFSFSGFKDGAQAMMEMTRVLVPGGRLVIVDIGLPLDHNLFGTFWARLWEWFGDFLYDIPNMMETKGQLQVTTFREFGPGRHIRIVVGEKSVEK